MSAALRPLTGIVTTDLAAITRGRFVPTDRLETVQGTGIGWLPANLALTAFGTIAQPNLWGSRGDLRVIPDMDARYRTSATGAESSFDVIMGDLVELDGTPWHCCPRGLLRRACEALRAATGLTLRVAFEQEFQLIGSVLSAEHPLSVAALRRVDPFAPRLAAALDEAGVAPEVLIAEFGKDQFEVTCAPAEPLVAADRAIAIRELTREIARNMGWRATFTPKASIDSVGNGVHIHFSFVDSDGIAVGFDRSARGGLGRPAAGFCAGILRHLPALTALTAPSVPSFYRLRPGSWSASWTWLAERDREASLRICPVASIGQSDVARQFNVEYRPADATANPYVAAAALMMAGLRGLQEQLGSPPIVAEHPDTLDAGQLAASGLIRLPATLSDALAAWRDDSVAHAWFPPDFVATWDDVRRAEMEHLSGLSENDICAQYSRLY